MLVALSTRICFSNRLSSGCNDLEISIFRQESFLRNVLAICKSSPDEIMTQLDELRLFIIRSDGPGFAQFTVPMNFSDSESSKVINSFLDVWKNTLTPSHNDLLISRKVEVSAFPFPRAPFRKEDVDLANLTPATILPIAGLGASFLFQMVSCDVIYSPDYLPLALLVEVLTRCEGPLYSSIRGQGYAYGAHLSIVLWTGQLCFEIMDASDPYNGLLCFYSILNSLAHNFSEICSQYEFETARASLAYRFVSERATSSGIIAQALRSSLRGTEFRKIDVNLINLQQVTIEDLKRVFGLYLTKFLNPNERFTFLTTPDGEKGSEIYKSFIENGFPVRLKPLKDFDLKP